MASIWPKYEDVVNTNTATATPKGSLWPSFDSVVKPMAPAVNKFGTDVSSHPFNPLNPGSQAVDANAAFPKLNPIKDVAKEIIPAVKTTAVTLARGLVKPFVEGGVSLVDQARNVQSIVKAVSQGKSTAMDYSERQYKVPLYGQAAPMFTGKEGAKEGAQKVVGNALEIAPYFLAAPEFKSASKILTEVGSKSLSEITAAEAGQFAVAYAKKLLVSSVSLGTMFGAGTSLKEKADIKTTGKNILRSIGTVAAMEAFLSPIISGVIGKGGSGSLEQAVDQEVLKQAHPEINGFPGENPIPKDVQAQVAKGEAVIPKDQQVVPGEKIPATDAKTTKTSGVATSIEQKAVEAKLTTEFKDLAGYEGKTVRDQSAKIAELVTTDAEKSGRIVRGEEPLPGGLSGSMFIKAMEDRALQTGDVSLIRDLASSPLVSETSVHAQELGFLNQRDPSSAVAAIREVAKAREAQMNVKDVATARDSAVKDIKTYIKKTASKESWSSFVDSIKC